MIAYRYIRGPCSRTGNISSKSIIMLIVKFYWGFAFLPKQITFFKKGIGKGIQGILESFLFLKKGHQYC